jgi:hypothetical protein
VNGSHTVVRCSTLVFEESTIVKSTTEIDEHDCIQ